MFFLVMSARQAEPLADVVRGRELIFSSNLRCTLLCEDFWLSRDYAAEYVENVKRSIVRRVYDEVCSNVILDFSGRRLQRLLLFEAETVTTDATAKSRTSSANILAKHLIPEKYVRRESKKEGNLLSLQNRDCDGDRYYC